jgi:hypothetical protein
VTKQKHKHSHQFECRIVWVVSMTAFNSISTLLHILGHPSCIGAVGHGWVVVEIYLTPDLYAFDVSFEKNQ